MKRALPPFASFPSEGGWAVHVSGVYPVYVVSDGRNVFGVAGNRRGLDAVVGHLFDVLAEHRLRHGGRISKTGSAPWMRHRPLPRVLVTRITARGRRGPQVDRYVVTLATDRMLRAVPDGRKEN